jgi:ferric iron reductase protein FhuF
MRKKPREDEDVDSDSPKRMALDKYRDSLIETEQSSQSEFDKTVLTLSGGALGISFAFVERFARDGKTMATWALASAWASWTFSLILVLASLYLSTQAVRRTIVNAD